jgi:hypothetical protein
VRGNRPTHLVKSQGQKGISMHRFLYMERILSAVPARDTTNRLVRALLAIGLMFGAAGQASAQAVGAACAAYQADCQGQRKSPLCAKLQQRCGGAASGAASVQSPNGNKSAASQLDNPTDMPDCTADQEIVVVPTCQCGSPLATGDAGGDNGVCSSCTSDGMRLECRPAH